MECHKCKEKIKGDIIFEGKILPFIADGERKFLCTLCKNNQPERLNPEAFKREGAQQNIDPDYIRQVGGLSDDLFGRCDSLNTANK